VSARNAFLPNLCLSKKCPDGFVKKYIPADVETGHVDMSTSQLVEQPSNVKGLLVQDAINFLNEENGLTQGLSWTN
jgi:hypothetical protein